MRTLTDRPWIVPAQEAPAALVFCARCESAVGSEEAAGALHRAARAAGLAVCGPEQRIYRPVRGSSNPTLEPRALELALPITGRSAGARPAEREGFFFQFLPPFRCLAAQHCGPWSELPAAWAALARQARASGHAVAGERREILHVFEWSGSAENIVELQLGLAGSLSHG